MRYGYWMPVFGGWLRNVPDEGMEASWDYTKRLTQHAERWGYDLTLIAELKEAAERIAAAVGMDVGGVEVMIDDRDGVARFYDINALSNFVARPNEVLGWDPHDRLVDFLIDTIEEAR